MVVSGIYGAVWTPFWRSYDMLRDRGSREGHKNLEILVGSCLLKSSISSV